MRKPLPLTEPQAGTVLAMVAVCEEKIRELSEEYDRRLTQATRFPGLKEKLINQAEETKRKITPWRIHRNNLLAMMGIEGSDIDG